MIRKLMKKVLCFLVLVLVIILLSHNFISVGNAAEATLLWDANDEEDLAGYAVYQSIDSAGPPYDLINDIALDELVDPKNPEVIVTQLEDEKKYHFVVTAIDKTNNESQFSNEICLQVVGSSIEDCASAEQTSGCEWLNTRIYTGNYGSKENKSHKKEDSQVDIKNKRYFRKIICIIYFKHNSTELSDKAVEKLDCIVEFMLNNPETRIEMKSYTHRRGRLGCNLNISNLRASAIKSYLASKGVHISRIEAKGLGPKNPFAGNKTLKGKNLNRRVKSSFIAKNRCNESAAQACGKNNTCGHFFIIWIKKKKEVIPEIGIISDN
jgi:outer membrane protein OmpA-like peptidoglycan-associated protein